MPKAPKAKAASQTSGITGVAFTVEASKTAGFDNFRICTLFIVDGEIVHIEKSQEYAGFETVARTEILVSGALWNLSSRYRHGLIQSLGGEHRDALVNRLKKTDPALLKRIAPALNLPVGAA